MTIPTTGAFSPANEAEFLRETERARLRALVSADIDRAQHFHAPDFQLITPIGVALSKQDYMGAIASGQLKYLAWQPGDIAVRLYEGGAVLRYSAQLEVVFGGHKVPLRDYWHTDTYEHRDGHWMVVWSQATAIR
ncbi:nuclear transport factor 2 family protein [Microvirga terrae]|uniref:Nuclear transport factor 2 family protein n=1 Tax=Microvirga terrae TaxID=2740529 RepID=A0ABY5RPN5_9HYPH|nr:MULTISPECIES: nuclear transport factor 2 family protein [Microvirga]MBQ0822232.1 nuclear transport factor 2 family protein [Microvirga sp. HBU67558]UVF19220.1 nuclear transport factor 2 family protein [Microvirga terrae]